MSGNPIEDVRAIIDPDRHRIFAEMCVARRRPEKVDLLPRRFYQVTHEGKDFPEPRPACINHVTGAPTTEGDARPCRLELEALLPVFAAFFHKKITHIFAR